MAKGQMRTPKEKKKPKAEWNKKKKGSVETSSLLSRESAYKSAYGLSGKKG